MDVNPTFEEMADDFAAAGSERRPPQGGGRSINRQFQQSGVIGPSGLRPAPPSPTDYHASEGQMNQCLTLLTGERALVAL